jgi:hypothetical protein
MSDSAASARITKPSKATAPTPSRIKLRASCDRCSTNKIKCSQEKPICQRCRSLDLSCHYSRSMRSGKPPRSRQRVTTFVGNIQSHPKPHLQSPSSRGDGYQTSSRNDMMTAVLNDIKMGPIRLPPTVPACVEPMDRVGRDTVIQPAANPYGFYYSEHTPEKFIINSSVDYTPAHSICKADSNINHQPLQQQEEQTPLSLLPLFRQINNIPEEQQQPPQQTPYISPCPSFSTKHSTLDTIASPLASTFDKAFVGTTEPTHDCVGLALATLSSLYNLAVQNRSSDAKTNGMYSSAPTIDQVFQVTSFATKNTMNLVSCPCAKDHCFPTLMSLIYSKILTWYQAIVGINDPDLAGWLGGCCSASTTSVVPRPLSIGTYKLEEEVGTLVAHQLVLNQLRDMAKSVKVFLNIFYGSRAALNLGLNETDHPDIVAGTGNGDSFQLRMGLSLDARLTYTIQEVERILPPCQC